MSILFAGCVGKNRCHEEQTLDQTGLLVATTDESSDGAVTTERFQWYRLGLHLGQKIST